MAWPIDPAGHPNAARLCRTLIARWPEHERFLEQSFSDRDEALMDSTERHSEMIVRIVGGAAALDELCDDYRFTCGKVLEEELYFRRARTYRLSSFKDAEAEVYANRAFMRRYMNMLLLSNVIWANHARNMLDFERRFLTRVPAGSRHLEIGPGHGLLLQLACLSPNIARVTGWDVSETSIAQTRKCLAAMGNAERVDLVRQDLFDAPVDGRREFDSVVMSEILEHLEDPVGALRAASQHMRPGSLLWVNVPVNSPAPDHIYLLRTTDEAVDLVRAGGFEPIETSFHPMTGATLERARKHCLAISAVVTARLP